MNLDRHLLTHLDYCGRHQFSTSDAIKCVWFFVCLLNLLAMGTLSQTSEEKKNDINLVTKSIETI